ncbi:probable glutamate receptor isoform X1 [Hylaeus volcanicus]|uniref:probable glutamate receptor isoform X1 n=1 Tax=Hylaeus volcanicus TaxID=313075 RepID=UPI0023B7C233|nr:probable glutamate receptor isoform X1 [Hylaeus volcanicus]
MIFAAWILAWLWIFNGRTTVVGHETFDYSFVKFVEDAITILYPPVMVSAHLCRLGEDETISLSRMMSRSRLTHEIHRDFEGFVGRTHDTWDHRILYMLDLDCDYAIPILRTVNGSDMFTAPIRWLLVKDSRVFNGNTTSQEQEINEIAETFRDTTVFPDSDVVLARRLRDDFMEIKSIYRPSPSRDVIVEDRGSWTPERGVRMNDFAPASRRRKNLQRTHLKSCLVMTDPDTINHLTDYENKHIDPITKANYPWVLNMVDRMNATISFQVTNTWGYRDENDSWSGMIGMLQRGEIDIGGTGIFFVKERIGVIDYVQLYTRTRSLFIFREPLLSTVSNIFTLPFQRSVWIAIGVFLLVVLVLLYFSTKWEYVRGTSEYWESLNPAEQTLSDNLMVVLGAVAQQGYYYEPYRVPPRIVTLMLLIAALSLYASYTANIVALLQSTTDSIKTLADLLNSPLRLGAQDIIYNRYYFKSFQDPVRRAIVDQRIEPKGQKSNWMDISEGVQRLRTELFAFHGERGTTYKIIQETFREEEKCGIQEIFMLGVLDPLMAVRMRSPYREIVRNVALLMHETGLKYREENRLYTDKPECQGQTSFISIGFTECYFALVSMGYGALLSLVVLALEIIWYKRYGWAIIRTCTERKKNVSVLR